MKYGVIILLATNLCAHAWWEDLKNVGPPVNTIYSEREPALAQISIMGAIMVFSSNRPGGYGEGDLWGTKTSYIFWPWENPANLGSGVNTAGWEGTPYFTHLDRKVYFGSDGLPQSHGGRDIWWCAMSGGTPTSSKVNLGPPVNTAYLDC